MADAFLEEVVQEAVEIPPPDSLGNLMGDTPGSGMPALWQHQVASLAALRKEFVLGRRRVVLCAPTGAGKTLMAAEMIRLAVLKGHRVVFIADRLTLIDQTLDVLQGFGFTCGRMQGSDSYGLDRQVVVASSRTLANRHSHEFDFAIVDECHTTGNSVMDWLASKNIMCVGLTATPFGNMAGFWSSVVSSRTTKQLIEDKILVPLEVWCCHEMNLDGVKKNNLGEYNAGEVEGRAIPIVGDVVGFWQKRNAIENRVLKTICFSASVRHGKTLMDRFNAAGYRFEQISYEDKSRVDREHKIDGLRNGSLDGLISVDALAKGFDVVDIECVIVCRPVVKSLATHIQILGRGMRSAEGKTKCIVHDHCGNYDRLSADTEYFWNYGPNGLESGKSQKASERQTHRKCRACGFYNPMRLQSCEKCGEELIGIEIKEVSGNMRKFDASRQGLNYTQWRNGMHDADVFSYVCHAIFEIRPEIARQPIAMNSKEEKWAKATVRKMTGSWLGWASMDDVRNSSDRLSMLNAFDPAAAESASLELNAMRKAYGRQQRRAGNK